MASAKPSSSQQDNTGSTLLAQYPPRISLDSPLLASAISLQESPLIAYAVFSGDPSKGTDSLIYIEHARRSVLASNTGRDILSSLLPAVHISKDTAALFVFALGSSDHTSESHSALAALQLEDLIRKWFTSLLPSDFLLQYELCAASFSRTESTGITTAARRTLRVHSRRYGQTRACRHNAIGGGRATRSRDIDLPVTHITLASNSNSSICLGIRYANDGSG